MSDKTLRARLRRVTLLEDLDSYQLDQLETFIADERRQAADQERERLLAIGREAKERSKDRSAGGRRLDEILPPEEMKRLMAKTPRQGPPIGRRRRWVW